ncbi:MAG: hypothetical protein CMO98_02325 [Woeseia sp.]|nr:hypothetical protein [Woeseia sp.]|tara:strand:+ start:1131 stop:1913 length:783 start_codon:yes stop_codon:yes gene_type:complete
MSKANFLKMQCENLSISVTSRVLLNSLQLETIPGEFLAILGPNGVGKSLALHTLAGLRPTEVGKIMLNDQPLNSLSRQELALILALMPQYTEDFFPATVFDTVMIGRHPHIDHLQWETVHDRNVGKKALAQVDLIGFEERDVLTLSGGERRRLAIAQILTQEPDIYLLDEPTNHLDPQHQLDVLKLFRKKAYDGKTIIASLHDINMAARFSDRCLLIFGDGRWQIGSPDRVLKSDLLSDLYATKIETLSWRDKQIFVAVG